MTGLNLAQLKHLIVAPTLTAIGLNSPAAVNLVTGTALVESGAAALSQIGGGPALGLWQMEPFTENDCWGSYLAFQPDLAARVRALMVPAVSAAARTNQLVGNLPYAAAMCRIKYRRAAAPLPAADDAAGLAGYWKAAYNSADGAGLVDAARIALFQQAINA